MSEAQKFVARAREFYAKIDYTRADLEAADGFARKATELDVALADGWGARAMVQAGYVVRGFVSGDDRIRQAKEVQTLANRALALQPDNPDALVALAKILEGGVGESFLRRAVAAHPDHERALLALGEDLRAQGKLEEAQAVFEDAARRHPRSILAHYDLSGNFLRMGDLGKAWDAIETALAIEPFMRGLLIKAYLAGVWRGDLPLMRATLDRLAPVDRTEDRAVYLAIWLGLLERQPERVVAAAAQTPRDYLVDATGFFTGPKAMLVAAAHHLAGKANLARQQWQAAEGLLRLRLQQDPRNLDDVVALATILVWLGQENEAQAVVIPVEQAWREQLTQRRGQALAEYHAARGDSLRAADYLRAALVGRSPIRLTQHTLRFDPRWDRLRGQTTFEAVVQEAAAIDAKSKGAGQALPVAAKTDAKSVAVLAFTNVGGDKENEVFSDGISEELINVLGRVPGLTVKGRASSFFFKGSTATAQEKGQRLGATYLVDGSVRKQGNSVRITAQVSRAATDEVVWSSEPLVRELKDMWAVQEEIAGLIAKALSLKLGVASGAWGTRSVAPAVYELYARGRQAWNLRTEAGYQRAEEFFNQAVALDPNFARAYVGLADVELMRNTADQKQKVMGQIEKALQLEPDLAEAHASRGVLYNRDFARFADAEREFNAAIRLNPNYASAYQWLGRLLEADGRLSEALVAHQRAMDLDPLSSRIADNYGHALVFAGRLTEAMTVLDRAVAIQSDNSQARGWRAWTLLMLGRTEEAVADARQILRGQDADGPIFASHVLYRANLRAEADAAFARIKSDALLAHYLVAAASRGDDIIAAFVPGILRPSSVGLLYFLPAFDAFRGNPRFLQVIDEAGVRPAYARAQAWRAAQAKGR